jgi:hypothetical protein
LSLREPPGWLESNSCRSQSRADDWRYISISLFNLNFDEEKAQTSAIAWLQQLSVMSQQTKKRTANGVPR